MRIETVDERNYSCEQTDYTMYIADGTDVKGVT